MEKLKKIFLFLYLLLGQVFLYAQFVDVESSIPPGQDWKKIGNSSVDVIFPNGLEKEAGRIASMIEVMNRQKIQSLGNKVRKVEIYLINTSLVSNGYVKVPPFHSKFFTRAPIDAFAGTTDWLDLLTIHEYRHVMQYNNALDGVTKWLYYVFGEPMLAGAAHLAIPPWFWEGDATVQETAYSFSGRGRLPEFSADLRAIANHEKIFSYEKMSGGSYKDRIPDRYSLGYALNAYARHAYGPSFWPDVYNDAVRYKRILWPFSSAIKKRTGKRTRDVYKSMMNRSREEITSSNDFNILKTIAQPENPTEYRYPKFRSENEIIAIKESFEKEAYFVSIKGNDVEKDLFPVGFGMGNFDVGKSKMIWNEITNHPRWADLGYSDLYIYNFEEGKRHRLSQGESYFAPGLSPDESMIFCVQSDPIKGDKMILLSSDDGRITDELDNPDNWKIGHHCWLDNTRLAIVIKENNRNALLLMNILDGERKLLIDFQTDLIEYPSFYQNRIYYLSNEGNAQNQIFAIDLQSGQKTRSKIKTAYALDMPEVSEMGKIAFVETQFNHRGIRVLYESIYFDHEKGMESQKINKDKSNFYEMLAQSISDQEGGPLVDDIPVIDYEVKDYSPGFSKLKLHTWMLNPTHPNYSVIFQANDPLGTLGLTAIPGYNVNEGAFFTDMSVTYGKFFPIVKLDMGIRNNRRAYFKDKEGNEENIVWDEQKIGLNVQLPLAYTKRNYYYYFRPVVGVDNIFARWYRGATNSTYNIFYFEARAGALRKRSYRSLGPINSMDASFSIQKVMNNGDLPTVTSFVNFYLPGFRRPHSMRLRFSHKYQDKDNHYIFFNNYYYGGSYNSTLQSDHLTSMRLEYALPLYYPDISIGPFVFVKRLRMTVFNQFDRYASKEEGFLSYQHFFGANFILDAKYFRLLDIPLGFQIRFINEEGDIQFDNLTFIFEL